MQAEINLPQTNTSPVLHLWRELVYATVCICIPQIVTICASLNITQNKASISILFHISRYQIISPSYQGKAYLPVRALQPISDALSTQAAVATRPSSDPDYRSLEL